MQAGRGGTQVVESGPRRADGRRTTGLARRPRATPFAWAALVVILAVLLVPLAGSRSALAQDGGIEPVDSSAATQPEDLMSDEVILDDTTTSQDDALLSAAAVATDLAPVPAAQVEAAAAPAVDPNWAPPRTVYIPETGHTIDGLFLDLWREWGGANAFGFPITPEIVEEDGHVVQYYGYARFEYWPEGDENGNLVTIADLGRELRPHAIPRSLPAGARSNDPNAPGYQASVSGLAREAMTVARAWLPRAEPLEPDGELYRFVPETGHSLIEGFKDYWEASGAEGYLGYPLTEEYVVGGVYYQVFERGQLTWEPGTEIRLVPIGEVLAARYRLPTEPVGQGDIPTYDEALFIPPPPPTPEPTLEQGRVGVVADPNAERWIEISIGGQYLIAWQGDVRVFESYVSTGRAGFDTPTGTFFVNTKLESEDMEGVIGGEYYNVPAVPWTMYFTGVGHAIHGTYWHSNFGTPMSHGCVNLPTDVAAALYAWSPIGMRVEITG